MNQYEVIYLLASPIQPGAETVTAADEETAAEIVKGYIAAQGLTLAYIHSVEKVAA
jgi:hypothetical protein